MSEWNVHDNPSESIPRWMMSPIRQEQTDRQVAQDRLVEFLPEGCRSCLRALEFRVKGLAHQVVKEEITKEAAIEDVVRYGGDCAGPIRDDFNFVVGCPSQDRAEQEEANGNI